MRVERLGCSSNFTGMRREIAEITDRSAYNLLQQTYSQHIIVDDTNVSWHTDVPLKVNPFVSDHLAWFGSFGGFSKRKKDIIRLVWFSSARVLWKERDVRLFKNSHNTIHHLLDNIKAQSFGWLKAEHKNLAF